MRAPWRAPSRSCQLARPRFWRRALIASRLLIPPSGHDRRRSTVMRLRWSRDDREIWRLAWPALGALVAEPLYVLADTAIVGRLGTPQLGGLALAASILLTAHAMFIFLAYGTTAAVARLLGAGEHRRAAHQAVQSIWLALAAGVVLAVAGLLLSSWMVETLGRRRSRGPPQRPRLLAHLADRPAGHAGHAGRGWATCGASRTPSGRSRWLWAPRSGTSCSRWCWCTASTRGSARRRCRRS